MSIFFLICCGPWNERLRVFGNESLLQWRQKLKQTGFFSLFTVALIKREVKATFNRMLKVPGFPLPGEDALELRRDCPPGCQHCAPFPSQMINEIKVHSIHFLACLSVFHVGVFVFCFYCCFVGLCLIVWVFCKRMFWF